MKTFSTLFVSGSLALTLGSCKPDTSATTNDQSRQQLEATQAEYARKAAEMQSRSEALQNQLAELQHTMQEKENAALKARLDAIAADNQKLMAEAEAAKTRSLELQQQLSTRQASSSSTQATPTSSNTSSRPWDDPSADYSMFYESLTPHGTWLNVEGYGYAFRPSSAGRSTWRPYVDGRWVSTEQGWAWDSREPFGWACYHYGRWLNLSRHGWVWLPGREWAPAWVSWRSGNDCVGWAPLPPSVGYGSIGHDCDARYGLSPSSYTFIQASHFGRSSYVNVSLSFSNVATFFHQTLNVTNIVRIQHQQTPLYINRGGPAIDWVEQRCGSRVERAPVQIARALERPSIRSRETRQAPNFIAAPVPSGRPDRHRTLPIAERVAQPTQVDGWKDVPDLVRDRLRQTITLQAKEPQPKAILVHTSPETPQAGPSGQRLRDGSSKPQVRPALPVPNTRPLTGQVNPSLRTNMEPTTRPSPHATGPGNPAEISRRNSERQLQQTELERLKQVTQQPTTIRQPKQVETQQAEQAPLRHRTMEQDQQALAQQQRETKAATAREAAAVTAQQQEAAQIIRQTEAQALQVEVIKRQEIEAQMQANKIRDQILAKQQKAKEEMTRREQELASQHAQMAAALKAQQEEAERLREAAMAAQQEAAERQRQIELQRQQQEAAMRAQQEAMERQREAAERAQQEAARRAQEEAMRQQEEARRAMEEAARRAAEEAAKGATQTPAQP